MKSLFRRKLAALIAIVGVRGLERDLNAEVSKATISRINRGWTALDMRTARLLGKKVGVCPCCDQPWRALSERSSK